MFWALPKEEVLRAFEWGLGRLKHRKRRAQTFFSLSKDGEKSFDHIGKSTDNMFLVTTVEMLRRFVTFDIQENNLFLLSQVVLQQGTSGVPIGGFLSAQLAELWRLWKEVLALSGGQTSKAAQDAWNVTLHRDTFTTSSGTIGIAPTPFPNGDVSRPLQFSEQQLLDLPDDSPVATSAVWEPVDSRIASLQLGGVTLPILITTPCDGSSGGRTHTILRFTPRRCLSTARDILRGYNVLRDVVNECLCPLPPVHEDCPHILLSRYRDNIYIMLSKIPPVLQHQGYQEGHDGGPMASQNLVARE